MSDTVISVLRQHLRRWSPEREQKAISCLQAFGLLRSSALINALNNNDPNIRLFVIDILRELDPIQSSLPALINALNDPNRVVRIAAVDPVARFGPKARVAIPILEKWLDDDKINIRIAAATAICKIDHQKIPDMMLALIDGLESRGDRTNAVYAIGELGDEMPDTQNLVDTWSRRAARCGRQCWSPQFMAPRRGTMTCICQRFEKETRLDAVLP